MSKDWGLSQEPVYGQDGTVVGAVVYDEWRGCWRGISLDGGRQTVDQPSRAAAERVVRSWMPRGGMPAGQVAARGGQVAELGLDQVVGAVVAGAALFGGLAALLGADQQPARGDDQVAELRRQNDELRRQNDMLRQALGGLGQQGITKRR